MGRWVQLDWQDRELVVAVQILIVDTVMPAVVRQLGGIRLYGGPWRAVEGWPGGAGRRPGCWPPAARCS
jgi:hypothetical protein